MLLFKHVPLKRTYQWPLSVVTYKYNLESEGCELTVVSVGR